MKKEVHLKRPLEPLQIPFPPEFKEAEKSSPDTQTLWVSCQPRWMTEPEIALAQSYLARNNSLAQQELIFTGAVLIDSNDPLLDCTHAELDIVERNASQPNTQRLPGGGTRSIYERVLIVRERGYRGGKSIAIVAGR